jgi:hypothetical protein
MRYLPRYQIQDTSTARWHIPWATALWVGELGQAGNAGSGGSVAGIVANNG